jgi:hypothetical protein
MSRGRLSAITDPVLLQEVDAIWQAITDRPQAIADSVARLITDENLTALTRFLVGERQGTNILLYRDNDAGPTLYCAKQTLAGTSNYGSAEFYSGGATAPTVKIVQAGDGPGLLITAAGAKIIDTSVGAYLDSGGVWRDVSHSSKKTVVMVPGMSWIKETVDALHVSAWRYKNQEDGFLHYGPMAEEFHALTGAGEDQTVAAMDVAAIAMLGVKWAAKKIDQLERRIAALEGR